MLCVVEFGWKVRTKPNSDVHIKWFHICCCRPNKILFGHCTFHKSAIILVLCMYVSLYMYVCLSSTLMYFVDIHTTGYKVCVYIFFSKAVTREIQIPIEFYVIKFLVFNKFWKEMHKRLHLMYIAYKYVQWLNYKLNW